MADKKSDLRVVRTRNALRAAFEELIAETTLDKITVKALTDRAGINRKTFYLHYETIEAFYDEIMNGIMDEFFEYYRKRRTTLGIWTVTPDVSFAIWPPSLP
ncbi:MAG: TetR/AcrR family transcriptional regulator [Adlercreutzia equolifaciens]